MRRPVAGRLLLLGDLSMRTWTLEGDRFLPRADPPLPSPGPVRPHHAMAFDPVRNRCVLFGGEAGNWQLPGGCVRS